ncbi:TonB-dependent receptor [Bacteroidota bacterium]|nr:TonB-dependent receptor [Bacteroidota bacterium]
MIRIKLIGIFLLSLVSVEQGFAQQQATIKIFDSQNHQPLTGVVVVAENKPYKQIVSVTDEDGFSKLQIIIPCFITLHLIGYNEIKFQLNGNDTTINLSPNENNLNEVVVTGEYNLTTSDKSVYNIRVIDAKEIEAKQSSSLADLLNTQLNIRLSEDNILGTGLSINGLNGQNIKILIDGVPVIGRENGNIDLSQILLSTVERIELIEGPMSSMYGTDAIGGLINIITKQSSKNRTEGNANALYESDGRYNFDGNVFFKIGSDHFSANGGRNFFDGFSNSDTGRWQQWKPYEQHFFGVAYGLKSRFTDVQLKADYFHQTSQNKGEPVITPYEAYAFDEYYLTDRWNITLLQSVRLTHNLKLDFTNAYSNYSRIRNTYRKDLVLLTQELIPLTSMQDTSLFNAFAFRGSISKVLAVNNFSFLAGYDINIENGSGQKLLNHKQSIEDYAAFGSFQWKLNKFTFRPALRYAFNTRYTEPIIPSLNFVFNADKNLALRLSYSRGFRAPSLKEMDLYFVDVNHNIHGNPDLKAEDSHHILFSANYSKKIDQSVIQLKGAFAYNNIQNIITLALANSSQLLYTYINIDNYQTAVGSIEANYQFQSFSFNNGFSLTGLYNSLSANDNSVPQFSYSPEWNSQLSFEMKKLNMQMNIQLKATGTTLGYVLDDSSNVYQNEISSYTMLDAGVTKSFLKKRISISVGGKNLLNVININSSVSGGIHSDNSGTVPNSCGRFAYLKLAFKFYNQ